MKEFLGKSVFINANIEGRNLFYTAKEVTSVSDTHITFIDKFNNVVSLRISDIVEIKEEGDSDDR